MDRLEGKTAVVTGAASGIGLGMTEAFANRGMRVVMADIEEGPLQAEAKRLSEANFHVTPSVTDVSSADDMRTLLEMATENYGAVQVLCNNAGVGGGGVGGVTVPVELFIVEGRLLLPVLGGEAGEAHDRP